MTVDEAATNGVGDYDEHYGHGAGRLQQLCYDHAAIRQNDVRCERCQFGCVFANALGRGSGPANINLHVAPSDPAQLSQLLQQSRDARRPNRIVLSERHEHPDAATLPALLRAHGERPRCRAAEKRDEVAPPHSITSSARARSVGGTSRPSALAVVRLMRRSNLVGCSTGISAGFAPRKILLTRSPVRRHRSKKFGPYDIRPPASTYSRTPYIIGSRAVSANVLTRTLFVVVRM